MPYRLQLAMIMQFVRMLKVLYMKYLVVSNHNFQMTVAPGFFPCLLTILGEQNIPHSVRIVFTCYFCQLQSAAIALKNRLRNRYNNDKEELINAADKDFLRNNIIPVVFICYYFIYRLFVINKIKTLLVYQVLLLRKLLLQFISFLFQLQKDFPSCWNCVDQIDSFLNSPNPQIIYNAVFVVRVF